MKEPIPPHILIVEDDPMIRWDFVDVFESAGFTVTEAASADEAEKLLGDGSEIDALLTDIEMPGELNGILLAWIAHRRDPSIRVIRVSGQLRPGDEELPKGAKFYGKPYAADLAVAQIQTMLGESAPP